MRHWRGRIAAVALVIAAVGLLAMWHWRYPHGRRHSCERALWLALRSYADANDGFFPAGRDSPAANLSLLYETGFCRDAEVLAGNARLRPSAEKLLESGGRLDSASCAWEYVPGLTLADTPELALFWCKDDVGHFGERLPGGGHVVVTVGGSQNHIRAADWGNWLVVQDRLHTLRDDYAKGAIPLVVAVLRLRDGTSISQYDGSFMLSMTDDSGASYMHSGQRLRPWDLRWYRLPFLGRTPREITIQITVDGFASNPADINLGRQMVRPQRVELEMRAGP